MIIDLYSEFDKKPVEEIPDEWWIERMTNVRNELLSRSDWRVVSDAPWDTEAWRTYRQQLRDFPATWIPAQTVEFPDPPEGS